MRPATGGKPIGIGLVGAGHWGPNLIRTFSESRQAEVVIVSDQDERRLHQVSARFPAVSVVAAAADVISHPDVEAVVIATPTSTHAPIAHAALDAGKHVLVEKPIASSAAEGEVLCHLAETRSLVLMAGHVFIYNPAVRRVKKLIDAGELGRIYYLSMVRTNLGPLRLDVNAAWDLAAHDISIANYWLAANALAVSASGGSWINDGLEDAVFATLRYPGGVLVNLHVSWLNPRKARDITVVGDRRMLTFDDLSFTEPIRIFDKQVTDDRVSQAFAHTFASFRASVRNGEITIPAVVGGEPLATECDHFLDCIRSGERPETDGRAGLAVVEALEAMTLSIRNQGREEQIGR